MVLNNNAASHNNSLVDKNQVKGIGKVEPMNNLSSALQLTSKFAMKNQQP